MLMHELFQEQVIRERAQELERVRARGSGADEDPTAACTVVPRGR